MSKFRKKMSGRHSRKLFAKTTGSRNVHPKNVSHIMPMRGGIRA